MYEDSQTVPHSLPVDPAAESPREYATRGTQRQSKEPNDRIDVFTTLYARVEILKSGGTGRQAEEE